MRSRWPIPSAARLLAACAGLLGACAADRGLDPGSAPVPATSAALETNCDPNGEFSFALTAEALVDWEGARVQVVAYEPSQEPGGATRNPVDVRGRVRDGRFTASCPRALRTNSAYPSVALYIDVNGDGRCGPGDLGAMEQYYAWSPEFTPKGQTVSFPGNTFEGFNAWPTVDTLGGSIGVAGGGFCAGFPD